MPEEDEALEDLLEEIDQIDLEDEGACCFSRPQCRTCPRRPSP